MASDNVFNCFIPKFNGTIMPEPRSNIPILISVLLASLNTGATTYAFGLYGEALKANLHLTQSELDTISSATFCAGIFSWLPGLCVDRFGAKCSISSGGLVGSMALLSFWAVSRQFVVVQSNLLVAVLSLFGVIVFLCSSLITGSVFKVIVSTCGKGSKGSAVGAGKGYVGLGSGVYTVLFESIKGSTETYLDFLPMSALFYIVAAALPAMCILPGKSALDNEKPADLTTALHFKVLYIGLATLAFLVGGESVIGLFKGHDNKTSVGEDYAEGYQSRDFLVTFLVLLAWFGPIIGIYFVPTQGASENNDEDTEKPADPEETQPLDKDAYDEPSPDALSLVETQPLDKDAYDDPFPDALDPEELQPLDLEHILELERGDHNLLEMLSTPPAWLMLWTCIILVGSGTVMTNNMGEMVKALGFSSLVNSSSMTLFSVAQAFARVLTGSISESALQWRVSCWGPGTGIARPTFLVVASIIGVVAHLLLAVAKGQVEFIIGVALSGVAFGMSWPLMVLIVGELFGTENVGANYLFYDGLTSALGTLTISKFVAQQVYNSHTEGSDVDCYGSDCFQATHFVVAALCSSGILTSVVMLYMPMTNRAYQFD